MVFSLNWKQALAFFISFVPALVFYALQKGSLANLPPSPITPPAHALQRVYDAFTHQLQDTINIYFDLVNTNKEIRVLRAENSQLSSNLQLLEEYRSENIRLRELLTFQKELPRKTVAARIISKDIFIDQKSIIIDKGSDDGIKRLQGVVSTKGIVGYVIDIEPHSAKVLTITDRGASVDALVQRTRARGIVSGISKDQCLLRYLMREQDVEAGDQIVTSGRQGFFPKGFLVGVVTQVEEGALGVSYQAQLTPAIEVDKLEEVLVIVDHVVSEDDSKKVAGSNEK